MDVDSEQKEAEEKLKMEAHPEQTKNVEHLDPNIDTPSSITPEDIRKRKRRSLTPAPDAEEVAKKAKIAHAESFVTKRYSRSPTPGSTATIRLPIPEVQEALAKGAKGSEDEPIKQQLTSTDQIANGYEDQEQPPHDGSITIDKDSRVEPSLQVATRSLYMCNFKRPLNIQTLRSHSMPDVVRLSEAPIQQYNSKDGIRALRRLVPSLPMAVSLHSVRSTQHRYRASYNSGFGSAYPEKVCALPSCAT